MRFILLVLALTALTFSQGAVFRNQLTMMNVADFQFFVEPASEIEVDSAIPFAYSEVPLPPSRNVVLGPPKFPVNIISGQNKPFCDQSVAEFNLTCSASCTGAVSRLSHPLTGTNTFSFLSSLK
jgi:hypothetical protein